MRQFSVSLVVIINENNHTSRHVQTYKVAAKTQGEAIATAEKLAERICYVVDTDITPSIIEDI